MAGEEVADHEHNDDAEKQFPLEGHFVVGGQGLYVTTGCLGRTFTSRTANFDLTIGLPQIDNREDPFPPEIRERLGEPAIPRMDLMPPQWAYGPKDATERAEEEHISPVWGGVMDFGNTETADGRPRTVYPESARDSAVVFRCRFETMLAASDGEEFDAAAAKFLNELDVWWTRFTAWVGLCTGQDFVGLGGNPGGITRAYPLILWTGESGQRVARQWRYYGSPNQGGPMSQLQLNDLEACVTATGNQTPPPPEWLFIRDARSLLRAGQARRAILDAGTGAELAMTTLIDNYLDDTQITDPGARTAFGRFNNLIAKQEVLKILRPGLLPKRTRTDLIEVRNTAIHGRSKTGDGLEEVTLEQAYAAVAVATEIVQAAHPVEDLLSL